MRLQSCSPSNPFLRFKLLSSLWFVYYTSAAPQTASDDETTAVISTITEPGQTSTITALTFFTPSSGAKPLPITSQSQLVTSYVPVLTICPYVPSLSVPLTAASPTAATASTAAASDVSGIFRRQGAESTAPYANSSAPTSYLSSCSVSYTPTTTQICHTTLSPLASPVIPITDCTQQVTFSADHGYKIIPSNKTADVQDLTTYYAAEYDVIATGVPQEGIRKEVCSQGGCSTQWEGWSTGVV